MSTQNSALSRGDQTGPSPSSARPRLAQRTSTLACASAPALGAMDIAVPPALCEIARAAAISAGERLCARGARSRSLVPTTATAPMGRPS